MIMKIQQFTKNIFLLLIIIQSSFNSAAAQEELIELDSIAAIVNEGLVLKSQLDFQIQTITRRASVEGFQLPARDIMEEQILEQLIVEEIQLQRAGQIGIQISDQMLNGAITMIAEENNIQFENLPAMLAADGIDYGRYRRDLRNQLILSNFVR